MAYYTVFASAPLLVIAVAITGFVLGPEAAQDKLAGQLEMLVGPEAARALQSMIASTYHPGAGIVATIIGVVILLVGATGVFAQLQDSLNTIWGVTPRPGSGIWQTVRDRFLTFVMVLCIALLMLLSLFVDAGISAAYRAMGEYMPISISVTYCVSLLVSIGLTTLLFALIYKWLPDAKVSWSEVWIGGVFTAILFTIGKFAIGLYLGRISSSYGAAASVIIILVWAYYSSQLLLFGAEFTHAYATLRRPAAQSE